METSVLSPSAAGAPRRKSSTRTIIVAKSVQDSRLGIENSAPIKSIPINLITSQPGPQKDSAGRYVTHSILGDAEEFAEMERLFQQQQQQQQQGNTREGSAGGTKSELNVLREEMLEELEEEQEEELELSAPFAKVATAPQSGRRSTSRAGRRMSSAIGGVTFAGSSTNSTNDSRQASRRGGTAATINSVATIEDERLNKAVLMQSYLNLSQERALRNWQRHSVQWKHMEEMLSRRVNKTVEELLMARLAHSRHVWEERRLLEEAIDVLEKGNVDFWKMGLKMGNDLVGLTMPVPKGGNRELERLFFPHEKRDESKIVYDYMLKRKEQLKKALSELDPTFLLAAKERGDLFLEVLGKKLDPVLPDNIKQDYLKRIDSVQCETEGGGLAGNLSFAEDSRNNVDLVAATQTSLVLSADRLTFELRTGEISTSVITMYNKTSSAIYFECVRQCNTSSLPTKMFKSHFQKFMFYHKSGVVLPGHAYDIPVIFTSKRPGIFLETWKVLTSPTSKTNPTELSFTLQAFVVQEDRHANARKQVDQYLERRMSLCFVSSIVNRLITDSIETCHRPKNIREEKKLFLERNPHHALYYSSETAAGFQQLYAEAAKVLRREQTQWDFSMDKLIKLLNEIPDPQVQSSMLMRFNEWIEKASVKREMNPVHLYSMGYDVMVQALDTICELSEEIRVNYKLPLVRSCVLKFHDEENKAPADTESADKKTGGKSAAEDKKKAAAAASQKKPAGASPQKAGSAASGGGGASGGKAGAGKKDGVEEEPVPSKPAVQVDTSTWSSWTGERRTLESAYRSELRESVSLMLGKAMERFDMLAREMEAGGSS